MMEYKGYYAKVDYDDENEIFHGEVLNLRDVITFQSTTAKGLKKELRASVEDYLQFCKERGEDPEKPYSGKFMLRIDPELHKAISIRASEDGKSLNAWVQEQLDEATGYSHNQATHRTASR